MNYLTLVGNIIIVLLVLLVIYSILRYKKEIKISEDNYQLKVSQGEIEGKKTLYKFGYNGDVDQTEVTVRTDPAAIEFPDTSFTAYIKSSDPSDTINGTGAKKVVVSGLDQNYDEKSITVELDGTTNVKIGDDSSWIRIFRAFVSESGSSGSTVGTLTIGNSGETSVYAKIEPGEDQTLIGAYTVPKGYTLYLDDITFTAALSQANKKIIVKVQIKNFGTNTFNTKFKNVIQSGTTTYKFNYPYKILEKSDIRLRAKANIDNNEVSGTFQGILVKN